MRLSIPQTSMWRAAAWGFLLPAGILLVGGFSPFHRPEPIAYWLLGAAGLISLWCALLACVEVYRRVRAARSVFQILLLVPLAFALFWPVIAAALAIDIGLHGVPPMGYGG